MCRPAAVLWATICCLLIFAQTSDAQHGCTYLGCFSFSRLLYLKGVEGVKPTQHSKDTIGTCFSKCQERGYSISIVATDFRCWCAISTPPAQALTDEAACEEGSSKGALVFYHYDGAQACRVEELEVSPSTFVATPQASAGSVTFDALGETCSLHVNSNGGTRVVPTFPPQLYGQFEVVARVSVHPGVVTAIDVQAAAGGESGSSSTKGTEDITWQFYNTTAAGIGKNILMGTASRAKNTASALDNLMKPTQYKTLAGLKLEENLGNTWVTYSIDWQKDRVTWAMNGVPLLTKWSSGTVTTESGKGRAAGSRRMLSLDVNKQEQQQRRGQQRKHNKPAQAQQQQPQPQPQPWSPPDQPAQLSFNVRWNPKAGALPAQLAHIAALDGAQSDGGKALHSSFMAVKRVVCDKARVRGDPGPVVPTWFVLGHGWNRKPQQQQPQQQPQQQQQKQKQKQKQQQQQKQQAKLQDAVRGGGHGDRQHRDRVDGPNGGGNSNARGRHHNSDSSQHHPQGSSSSSRYSGNSGSRRDGNRPHAGRWQQDCVDCPQKPHDRDGPEQRGYHTIDEEELRGVVVTVPYKPIYHEADMEMEEVEVEADPRDRDRAQEEEWPGDEGWPDSHYKEDAEIWAEMEREEEQDAYLQTVRDAPGHGRWRWSYHDSDETWQRIM